MYFRPNVPPPFQDIGTAACQGDSGGPVTQDLDGQSYLLGIVSWGPAHCARDTSSSIVPDIFTDVRYFANWIRSRTAEYVPNPRVTSYGSR